MNINNINLSLLHLLEDELQVGKLIQKCKNSITDYCNGKFLTIYKIYLIIIFIK